MTPSGAPSQTLPAAAPTGAPTVLVVDDDQEMCELAEASLNRRGYKVTWRLDAVGALAELDRTDFSVVLVDIHMGGMSGIELCSEVLLKRPSAVVVVMTGFGTMEDAIGAMRAGAYDFITKPISMDALSLSVDRASRHHAMSAELKRLRRRVDHQELPNIVGHSEAITRMASVIERIAETDTSVLITGESGTGKELIARAVHERSGRTGPFLAVNCAALPETLLESELFGHARGAFTDARESRKGLFVEAHNGTLFLDEIGEIPLGMQAKLLRALQERKVRPLGTGQEIPFDARIITATNRELEGEVAAKRFREDLFYRINVVRIDAPPLRARGNDMLLLAQFFLERAARRSDRKVTRMGRLVAEKLTAYEWPGNVRELENCMERAVALARFDEITLDDLPDKVRQFRPTELHDAGTNPLELPSMEEVEERHIVRVLSAVGGNKTLAAKVLKLDRRTLYRKLKPEVVV
jgi:two-component system response regulator HydG